MCLGLVAVLEMFISPISAASKMLWRRIQHCEPLAQLWSSRNGVCPTLSPSHRGSRWDPHILLGMGGEEGEELSWGFRAGEGTVMPGVSLGVHGGSVCAKPSCLKENQGWFGSVGVPWSPHPPRRDGTLLQCFVDALGPSDGCRGGAERCQPWTDLPADA